MSDPCDENLLRRKIDVVAAAHATIATIVPTIYNTNPKEPYADKAAQQRVYMNSIIFNDNKCCANLRMSRDAFLQLCSFIRKNGVLKDTKNVQVEEMLMRFLHLIGHNVRHSVLVGQFFRSGETISRQFNETLVAILSLYKCLVADHAEEIHKYGIQPKIGSDARYATYFKDCIDALDGTHCNATVPEEEQDRFRDRKTKMTQNVLATCSFDLKFTYVLAGWEGSAHDQKVLDNARSRSNPFIVPQGKYYLVDDGYTHEQGFLVPFKSTRYHISEHRGRTPENEKELFNKRHSSLRNAIERAFGVLKKWWPMLSVYSFYLFKTQLKIVMACFILHSHIMGVDPTDPLLEEVDRELEASIGGEEEAPIPTSQEIFRATQIRWIQFRNNLAKKMYDDYKHRQTRA